MFGHFEGQGSHLLVEDFFFFNTYLFDKLAVDPVFFGVGGRRGQGWRGKPNWKMLHVDPGLRPHHLETQPEMKSLFLTLLDPPPTIGDSHALISSTHFSD